MSDPWNSVCFASLAVRIVATRRHPELQKVGKQTQRLKEARASDLSTKGRGHTTANGVDDTSMMVCIMHGLIMHNPYTAWYYYDGVEVD